MFRSSTRAASVLLGLACGFGLPATTTPATAAPDDPAISVDVRITSFSPIAPKPGDAVTITGTATNTGTTPLTNTQAIACIDAHRLSTRAAVAAVPTEGGDCQGLGGSTAFDNFADVLEPATTRPFTITVPWKQWEISRANGVYVVGVRINGDDPAGGRSSPGRARVLMPVMSPTATVRQVRTAMVLPVRHQPTQVSGSRFVDGSLDRALAPTGRLGRLVRAAAGLRVSWLIDPSLLDEARQLAAGFRSGSGSDARPERSGTAANWLIELSSATAGDPVALLPYADPDIRALTEARLGALVTRSMELTAGTGGPATEPVGAGVWLENGSASEASLAAVARTHTARTPIDLTVLSDASWAPAARPAVDGSSLVRVTTAAGPLPALVTDSRLTAGGPDPVSADSAVQLRQRFAAETALLALGNGRRPDTATVAVTAIPARGIDTTDTATTALLQVLRLPWVTPIGVDELGVAGAATPTVGPPDAKTSTPALSKQQLEQVRAFDRDVATYGALQSTADAGRAVLERAVVRGASSTWRSSPAAGDFFRRYQTAALRQQFDRVRILATSGDGRVVTLSGSDGRFPLTVANDLTRPVRVGVEIESLNRDDLTVERVEPVVIRGGNRETFEIHASAQQNGLIRARVYVVTADGRRLGRPLDLDIRAAQYGTVGWMLVGSAVALLFGTSAIRIYRRIRTERQAAARVATTATGTIGRSLAGRTPDG